MPDLEALGNGANSEYYIAQFRLDADNVSEQTDNNLLVNIQTDTGKPVAFPNANLSNWISNVEAKGNNGNLWALTTNTSSQAFLQKAYLDYGTKAEVDSEKVSIAIPSARLFLKLTATAKTG